MFFVYRYRPFLRIPVLLLLPVLLYILVVVVVVITTTTVDVVVVVTAWSNSCSYNSCYKRHCCISSSSHYSSRRYSIQQNYNNIHPCWYAISTTVTTPLSSSLFMITPTTIDNDKEEEGGTRNTSASSASSSTSTSVLDDNVVVVVNGDTSNSSSSSNNINTNNNNNDSNEPLQIQQPIIVAGNDNNNNNIFSDLAYATYQCLYQSDLRRDAAMGSTSTTSSTSGSSNDTNTNNIIRLEETRPSSATNWVHTNTAQQLQFLMKQITILQRSSSSSSSTNNHNDNNNILSLLDTIRWYKNVPQITMIDLSNELHTEIIQQQEQIWKDTKRSSSTMKQFLQERIQCRLLLFPSGTSVLSNNNNTSSSPLIEPPASVIYGTLLYGGITRYRLLGSSSSSKDSKRRKVGVYTDIYPSSLSVTTTTDDDNDSTTTTTTTSTTTKDSGSPSWMMYGGTERVYESMDMGSAAILEVILFPHQSISLVNNTTTTSKTSTGIMQISNIAWKPQAMFTYPPSTTAFTSSSSSSSTNYNSYNNNNRAVQLLSGKERNDVFQTNIQSSVGGLQKQINIIVRRVLDGRVIRPILNVDDENNKRIIDTTTQTTTTTTTSSTASMEAEELALLGLTPVRGLLLYGPPGCGKTALAREISRALRARTPKIVSAPELLDRWVGGSEKLVRQLFADAEAELAACNNDVTKSALHVIVIDEIDAVFRKRSSSEDTGEATRSSVVNQILAKLDGVKSIGNVLLIGMTNRKELLDDALLRPGRLEVQIEIPLPDMDGRREIFNIHFNALRQRGRLSHQLCCAIDGTSYNNNNDDEGLEDERPALSSSSSSKIEQSVQVLQRVIDPIVPVTPQSVLNVATEVLSNNILSSATDIATISADIAATTTTNVLPIPSGAIITDISRFVRRTIFTNRSKGRKEQVDDTESSLQSSSTVISNNNESRKSFWIGRARRFRTWLRYSTKSAFVKNPKPVIVRDYYDLASDDVTGGFSGADIAGLVRCAGSLALARCRNDGYSISDGLLITLEDVKAALKEIRR